MNYEGNMEVSKNRSATSRNVSQGNGHTYMTVVELNVCLWADHIYAKTKVCLWQDHIYAKT